MPQTAPNLHFDNCDGDPGPQCHLNELASGEAREVRAMSDIFATERGVNQDVQATISSHGEDYAPGNNTATYSWFVTGVNCDYVGCAPDYSGGGSSSSADEIGTRPYVRGTVGMPRSGNDTGGCQIFITHLPTPHLDGNYSVYAQVIEGLDVIDKIRVGDTIEKATLMVREEK